VRRDDVVTQWWAAQVKWSREGSFKFELESLSVYLGNNEL
jgi:hypothetical protein